MKKIKGRRDDGQVVFDADVRMHSSMCVAHEVAKRSAKFFMQASESVALSSPYHATLAGPERPSQTRVKICFYRLRVAARVNRV